MSKDLSNNEFALSINEVNLERLKDRDCTDAERLAIGLVLARSGMSIEATAETVGMSVHHVWKKVAPHVSRDEKDALIEELALDASVHLSLEIMDRLKTPGAMRSAEVIKAAQVMTNIVGVDPGAVHIGQAVRVVFDDTGEGPALPRFTPA